MKLTRLNEIPTGLLDLETHELWQVLPGPTLIELPGRREEPIFLTVLAHGNEDTGWLAVREVLKKHQDTGLPRALFLFIGNVEAAKDHARYLDHQVDLNRVWSDRPEIRNRPERAMAIEVEAAVTSKPLFACIDVHNNTGQNPHYGCVAETDSRTLHLATLFSRRVLHFGMPDGVQTIAFARHCPTVTVECGLPSQAYGVEHARDYIEACLHLPDYPSQPVPPEDLELYHSVAIMKVPDDVSLSFGGDGSTDLQFPENFDSFNFSELPAGTCLAKIRPGRERYLTVINEANEDVFDQYLQIEGDQLCTKGVLMPSMLTCRERIVRQDCLGYLMERV